MARPQTPPLPVMKLCIACSAELPERADLCEACGAAQPHLPTVYFVWGMAFVFMLSALKACWVG